ncbi:hypothetical protein SCP_0705580 [Sparassis crispa]|uniref:Uncharacterized protein n=1 Tax=Sparassis crispa TaxID=139825 RepID=A0A401GSZ7_9APHY|nr:hypothetical protein SCP_0705580 [Sparassis crispa]GBE85371.1 hypothetical protein SCP_0705580 [Sparassis crispa]
MVTGVSVKDKWPVADQGIMLERKNEQAGETYLNPSFDFGVQHADNRKLLLRVRDIVYGELMDEKTRPEFMNDSTMLITADTVYELAKTLWSGFKEAYRGQIRADKKVLQERNAQNTRRMQCRRLKSSKLLLGIPTYIKEHGVDPRELITPEMMSDDASGPEIVGEETKDDWRKRMAEEAGMGELPDSVLQKLRFFEIIRPNWRSEEYSDILHKLWDYFWATLQPKDRQEFNQRVYSETRSSDHPPAIAPFNFGINREWYEKHKDTYPNSVLLHDWYTFGDPAGFGQHADSTQGGADDDPAVGGDEDEPNAHGAHGSTCSTHRSRSQSPSFHSGTPSGSDSESSDDNSN